MTHNTISDALTIPGGEGTLLANRYRVVRQLGQGGMGSVWLAEDTKLRNRLFAIKMLPSVLVRNKKAYRQLGDEALVAMKLTHPNIVTLRAFEEDNGNPFLVMDYVDGQTLDDYLAERGKLTEDETIRILKPIAAALDYAHGEGVVHRDVKPANIMIRKDGHPYILDFGIAREIQETMTRVTGKLSSGTLLYMSPEQLDGDPPKKEQDIYSFAAMAYECFKGEPPFVRGAIEDQIRNKRPVPLTGGPRSVAASIMAGLAKKPEGRPPSCTAILGRNGFSRVEHVEGNASRRGAEAQRGCGAGKVIAAPVRNIARIAIPVACIAAALLIVGVVLWHRESQRQEDLRSLGIALQEELSRRQTEDERKAQEAAARKKAEAERLAKLQQEEAERKVKEEAARIEAEHKAKEEKAAAERKAREIAEREAEEKRIAAEARAYTNCLEKIDAFRRDASNEYAKAEPVRRSPEGLDSPIDETDVHRLEMPTLSSDEVKSSVQLEYRVSGVSNLTAKRNDLWHVGTFRCNAQNRNEDVANGLIDYKDNVRLSHDLFKLRCDRLIVMTKKDEKDLIQRLLAIGNVKIDNPLMKAQGAYMSFSVETGEVSLSGEKKSPARISVNGSKKIEGQKFKFVIDGMGVCSDIRGE